MLRLVEGDTLLADAGKQFGDGSVQDRVKARPARGPAKAPRMAKMMMVSNTLLSP